MNASSATCPLPRTKVIDLYFMEHRAKLLDIAAFLDRIERAESSSPSTPAPPYRDGAPDFRIAALLDAVKVLLDGKPERAQRVLELLSDPTREPMEKAGMKGASGAWPGKK